MGVSVVKGRASRHGRCSLAMWRWRALVKRVGYVDMLFRTFAEHLLTKVLLLKQGIGFD